MDASQAKTGAADVKLLRRIGLVYVSDTEPGIRRERRGRRRPGRHCG